LPAERPRIPRPIWALGVVSLLMDASSEAIHSLLPVFVVVTLGASPLALGWLEGLAEATAALLKAFSGVLSDRLGRRKALAVAGYGLSALSKPLFALAGSLAPVFVARIVDRVGKGVRGAPRDALVAELAPAAIRGACFGLRQALDTVGAFLGPLLAMALMVLLAGDIRAVFWVSALPALLAVAVLWLGVREPDRAPPGPDGTAVAPRWADAAALPRRYWMLVVTATLFSLARFSEAFLLVAASENGLALRWVPIALVVMNVCYAAAAYPAGALSDRLGRRAPLAAGCAVLIGADVVLALAGGVAMTLAGIGLWGIHLALTQGQLTAMVADRSPARLHGTAFGLYHLASGLALLGASLLAGALWQARGPSATFTVGALLAALALASLAVLERPASRA